MCVSIDLEHFTVVSVAEYLSVAQRFLMLLALLFSFLLLMASGVCHVLLVVINLLLLAFDAVQWIVLLEHGLVAGASLSPCVQDALLHLVLQVEPLLVLAIHLLQDADRELVAALLEARSEALIRILDLTMVLERHVKVQRIL